MFARPRPKKSTLPLPLPKKRKQTYDIEQIAFDETERADYLTGFRKRKLQRVKHAQELAAEKARLERIAIRRQVREARLRQGAEHADTVARLLREAEIAGRVDPELLCGAEWDEKGDAWGGIADADESEYMDDDKFTAITIESVTVSRDGMHSVPDLEGDENKGDGNEKASDMTVKDGSRSRSRTKQHRTFRYQSKDERRNDEVKTRIRKAKRKQSRLKNDL